MNNIPQSTAGLRMALAEHPIYDRLQIIDDVRRFMESHIYAVWDFMSLLKALQRELTCVEVPWKPVAHPKTARFINEIVLGEETDIDPAGQAISHFEMYRNAMRDVGADVTPINTLLANISSLADLDQALDQAGLRPAERAFLDFTFATIRSGAAHRIAAAFTYGREDLIPDMFLGIVRRNGEKYPNFEYYLERHIELDGDEHGPLALQMIEELCGQDATKWQEAEETAVRALEVRRALWDEISASLGTEVVA